MAISKNLQPQEVEFLKFQKKRGVDAKQAFEKLNIARDRGLFTKWTSALSAWPQQETLKSPLLWPSTTDLIKEQGNKLEKNVEQKGFLENPISETVTKFWQDVVKEAKEKVTQATGSEVPFTKESKLAENFVPSSEKAFWELAETIGSPIDSLINLWSTLKAITVVWMESDPILWRLLKPSDTDKAIQEALTESASKVKDKITQKWVIKTVNEALQEDPALAVTMVTSIFKKLWRSWNLSKKEQLKIDELRESAEADIEKFLKPTKEKTKEITDKISWEVVDRNIQGTRKEVSEVAKLEVKRLDKEIDNFVESDQFTGEINISKLNDELNKFEDKLIEPKSWLIIPWRESDFKFIVDTREFLEDLATKTGNNLSPDQSQFLKKSFNQVFKGNLTSLEKFQNSVKWKLGLTLRDELAKDNPALDSLNKDFSFWISLDNVLDETIKRTKGQWEGGWLETKASTARRDIWKGWWAAVGWSIWGAIAGTEWAIVWAALWSILWLKVANKIDLVASSPKYKLISAQKKKDLADAITSQDAGKVEKILDSIIIAQWIQTIWEPAE